MTYFKTYVYFFLTYTNPFTYTDCAASQTIVVTS